MTEPPASTGTQPASGSPEGRASPSRGGLARDSLLTIGTRFGLAILILATDIVLARLLGPSAKGRFTLVLLLSQLAAVVAAWGMDAALGVVAGRSREDARRGFANAVLWTLVVGGLGGRGRVLAVRPSDRRPAAWPAGPADPQPVGRPVPVRGARDPRRAVLRPRPVRPARAPAGRRLQRDPPPAAGDPAGTRRRRGSRRAPVARRRGRVQPRRARRDRRWPSSCAARRDGTASLHPSRPLLVEELRFGTRVLPGALAERLQLRSDAFLLNLLVGVRATGVYSVTAGLAETLWYIPNALGTVMFSRAVDPAEDAAGTAVVLTRVTMAITILLAVPAFVLGPWLVEVLYGSDVRRGWGRPPLDPARHRRLQRRGGAVAGIWSGVADRASRHPSC